MELGKIRFFAYFELKIQEFGLHPGTEDGGQKTDNRGRETDDG